MSRERSSAGRVFETALPLAIVALLLVWAGGAGVPTLVILLGAIGGMIGSGILGLFTGAVVLALVYGLFVAWLDREMAADGSG